MSANRRVICNAAISPSAKDVEPEITIVSGVYRVEFRANPTSAIVAGRIRQYSFGFKENVQVSMFTNAAGNTYQVFDSAGNPITLVLSNTTTQVVFNANAETEYILEVTYGAGLAVSVTGITMTATSTPTVYTYFENGFDISKWDNDSRVSSSTDANGTVTLTFTNYPLTRSVELTLASTEVANLPGQISGSSSNTALFSPVLFAIAPPGSYNVKIVPLQTGTFSFISVISVVGVGTSTPCQLILNSSQNINSSGVNLKKINTASCKEVYQPFAHLSICAPIEEEKEPHDIENIDSNPKKPGKIEFKKI